MVDTGLDVTGGAGGITANYADMLSTAAGLDAVAEAVTERAGQIGAVVSNGDLAASTVLSPGTAAQVAADVTAATLGPGGLVPTAARLKATGHTLRASVTAYRTVDQAQAFAVTTGQAAGAPLALLGLAGVQLVRADLAIRTGQFQYLSQIPGLAGQDAMNLLYDQPWIVDGVITDAPLLLWGAAGVVGPAGTAMVGYWTYRQEGVPFPPVNLETATGDIVAIGEAFGWFQTGGPRVEPLGDAGRPPDDMALPVGFEQTMAGIGQLGRQPGTLRVFAVPQPDGTRRWVVQIPGTQEWSPTTGENPVDLTNNLRLMAGQQTEQNEAIRDAMRQAGVAPGEPVMLAGHSQGGITAASLAADPATRAEFNVTNVYTGGSPIARFNIPPEVTVLSVEHTQDAVPRLDGQPNPDRPTWVTVTRDPTGVPNRNRQPVTDTPASHDSFVYADTAGLIDTSSDPSIAALRESFRPFLTGDSQHITVQTFQMTREPK